MRVFLVTGAGVSAESGLGTFRDNDAVVLPGSNLIVGRKPFSFDDRAAGRDWSLLVLRRKRDRAHLTLEFDQHVGRFVLGNVVLISPGMKPVMPWSG